MRLTIDTARLDPGVAVKVCAVAGTLAVEVADCYTLPQIVGALGPALERAINLSRDAVDA